VSKLRPYIFALFFAFVASASCFAGDDHIVPKIEDNYKRSQQRPEADGTNGPFINALDSLDKLKRYRELSASAYEIKIGNQKTKNAEFLNEENGQTKLNKDTCTIAGRYNVAVQQTNSDLSGSIPVVDDKAALEEEVTPKIKGKRVFARTSFESNVTDPTTCVQHWMRKIKDNPVALDSYLRGDHKTYSEVSLFDPIMETFCIVTAPIKGGYICSVIATFPEDSKEPLKDVAADDKRLPAGRAGVPAAPTVGGAAPGPLEPGAVPQVTDSEPAPPPGRRPAVIPGTNDSSTAGIDESLGGQPTGQPGGGETSNFGLFALSPQNQAALIRREMPSISDLRKNAGALGEQFGDISQQLGIFDPASGGQSILPLEFDDADPTRLVDSFGNDVPEKVVAMTVQYYDMALQNGWLTGEEQQRISAFMNANGGAGGGDPNALPIDPSLGDGTPGLAGFGGGTAVGEGGGAPSNRDTLTGADGTGEGSGLPGFERANRVVVPRPLRGQ
jgi:hypothetical protein